MEQYSFNTSTKRNSGRRKWWIWGTVGVVGIVAIGGLTVLILSHFSGNATKKGAETLAAPTVAIEVIVDTSTNTSATITWSGIQAASYELECAPTSDFSGATRYTTTQASGTCSNLQPLHAYYVHVRIVGGAWSKPKTFATSGETILTVGVQVKRLSSTTATVTWQKAASVETYQLQYSTDKTFSKQVETQTAAGNSATLQSLRADTIYYVRVKAVVTGVADNFAPYSVPVELK